MNKQASVILAAGLLTAGIPGGTAVALELAGGGARMTRPASDTLNLTSTQRTRAWNDLEKKATEQKAPPGFTPIVGTERARDRASPEHCRKRTLPRLSRMTT
jgi:hypothetical protein